jgi:Mitochondrial carrier protein
MSAKSVKGEGGKKPAGAAVNLIAGGGAGMMEALACHPLDTIKVRMQLSRRKVGPGQKKRGFLQTGKDIVKRETAFVLYKGLGAVLTGIVPKMAIRFTAYEWYKQLLADENGVVTAGKTFTGGCMGALSSIVTNIYSRSWSGHYRSRGRGDAHGSSQNSNASSIPQSLRSSRHTQISKRPSRRHDGSSRRRSGCSVARRDLDSRQTGDKSGSEFHRLHRAQSVITKMATTVREPKSTELPDNTYWLDIRSYGTFLECSDRYNKNPPAKDACGGGPECHTENNLDCKGYVQTRGSKSILQRYHPESDESSTRPGCHLHGV